MFKTLREKVQEAEIAHVDPTTIVLRSTKKRYVFIVCLYPCYKFTFDEIIWSGTLMLRPPLGSEKNLKKRFQHKVVSLSS